MGHMHGHPITDARDPTDVGPPAPVSLFVARLFR